MRLEEMELEVQLFVNHTLVQAAIRGARIKGPPVMVADIVGPLRGAKVAALRRAIAETVQRHVTWLRRNGTVWYEVVAERAADQPPASHPFLGWVLDKDQSRFSKMQGEPGLEGFDEQVWASWPAFRAAYCGEAGSVDGAAEAGEDRPGVRVASVGGVSVEL